MKTSEEYVQEMADNIGIPFNALWRKIYRSCSYIERSGDALLTCIYEATHQEWNLRGLCATCDTHREPVCDVHCKGENCEREELRPYPV